MKESIQSYYKICRKMAGMTQEQASEKLAVEVRTLSGYENGNKVPEDIVAKLLDVNQLANDVIKHLNHLKISKISKNRS